jgi:hypothetical protein
LILGEQQLKAEVTGEMLSHQATLAGEMMLRMIVLLQDLMIGVVLSPVMEAVLAEAEVVVARETTMTPQEDSAVVDLIHQEVKVASSVAKKVISRENALT